jgi:HSP20 family protein
MNPFIRYNALPGFMPRPIIVRYAKPMTTNTVAVNVKETETAFEVIVAAPGLTKTDFTVNVVNQVLTVAYKAEAVADPSAGTFTRHEFAVLPFERSFKLPATINIEQIAATYANGILTIGLPKVAKVEPVAKEIAIA